MALDGVMIIPSGASFFAMRYSRRLSGAFRVRMVIRRVRISGPKCALLSESSPLMTKPASGNTGSNHTHAAIVPDNGCASECQRYCRLEEH